MIKSLSGIVLRFLKANKGLSVSAIISVALSLFLILSMIVFSQNAKLSLEQETKLLFGEMDIALGYHSGANKHFNNDIISQVTTQDRVEQFSKVLISQLRITMLQTDVYTVGVENDSLVKSRYHFNTSIEKQEVIMNTSLAETLGLAIGDSIEIENESYTLIELLPNFDSSGISADLILMPRDEVKQFIYEKTGFENEVTYMLLKAQKDANPLELVQALQLIDSDFRIDLALDNEFYTNNLKSLNYFMIVLSILVLLVVTLFIIANADLMMYKMQNQIAIMRSIGATKAKVLKIVWLQLGVLNLLGTITALILSIISKNIVLSGISGLVSIATNVNSYPFGYSIFVALAFFVIIQMFMIVPAYRSTKIIPLKIVEQNEDLHFKRGKQGKIAGIVYICAALLLIMLGFINRTTGSGAIYFLIASICVIAGFFYLFKAYVSLIFTFLTPLFRRLGGPTSFVAIQNLIPHVRKNTFIILIVSMLMIISLMGSTLFSSINQGEKQFLQLQYPTNIVVTSRAGYDATLEQEELSEHVKKITGIDNVSTLSKASTAYIQNHGKWASFTYGLGNLEAMRSMNLITSYAGSAQEQIIITEVMADRFKLSVGDSIEIGVYSNNMQNTIFAGSVTVTGIFQRLPGTYYDAYVDWGNINLHNEFTLFDRLFIESNNVEKTLSELKELNSIYPLLLQFNSLDKAMDKSNEMFIQRWAIFIAVLVTILISVMLGVCNALINNIQSKRKEYALLRTISVTGKGIIKIILTQVVVYIMLGIGLGLITGTISTWIIGFTDGGSFNFDIKVMITVATLMLVFAVIVFLPYANWIRKQSLPMELTQDNK